MGHHADVLRYSVVAAGILSLAVLPAASTADATLAIAFLEGSIDQSASRAVMEEAYRRLGVSVSFSVAPAGRAMEAVSEGRLDGELQHYSGMEKRYPDVLRIPIPINYIDMTAVSRQFDFPIRGWHSLRPYRIGIVAGIVPAEEGTRGMNVRKAAGNAELLDLLHGGKIDVAVMDRVAGRRAAVRDPRGGIHAVKGSLETFFVYHYLHAQHAELAARLREVLEAMLLDGTTQRLRALAHERLPAGPS